MNPKHFFAELRRRNVYKVAVAYAVVGWLVMQVAATVVPALHLSDTITTAVVILVLLGFPIALVLAWAFELTPQGIKRTEEIGPGESITRRTGRKLTVFIAILLLVAVGLLVLQVARHYPSASATKAPAASDDKSVAVLPFTNLSRDPENAYFAAGIQEEIITRLAKITQLRAISCTSTERFKNAPDDLPGIAKQLGVANVLQGSVQRSGDAVRFNVQLVKADNNAHLWAETFNRKLTDIFKIESEIARTVAETLQAKLSGSEQHAIAVRPTENPAAHQLYLKGLYFWNKRRSEEMKKALDYFQQAAEQDPNYALAWVGIADSYNLMPLYDAGNPLECRPKAEAAAKKALELDDSSAEAHASLGFFHYSVLAFDKSVREFERSIQLDPNYATAHHWFGRCPLTALGQFDRAIAEGKRAMELDPLSFIINADLGVDYYFARRYDEAISQLQKTLEIDPNFYYAHWTLGRAFEMKGNRDAAIKEYRKAWELSKDPWVLGLLSHAYAAAGNRLEAERFFHELDAIARERYVPAHALTIAYLGLGNKEQALHWLEKGYQDQAGRDVALMKVEPFLDPLRNDPRFQEFIAKIFSPNTTQSSPPSP